MKLSSLYVAFMLATACGPNSNTASDLQGLETMACGYGGIERNDGTLQAIEQQIVAQVNQTRQAQGLLPLAQHDCISSVAYFHSVNMAKNLTPVHVLDGKDVKGRLVAQGVISSYQGENLHFYTETRNGAPFWDNSAYAGRAMDFWLNSPPHRANILNPNFRYIGVGISKTSSGQIGYFYGTQVFMTE